MPTSDENTVSPSHSTTHWYRHKKDAVSSVSVALGMLKDDPTSIIIIRRGNSEGYFVHIVTTGSLDVIPTLRFSDGWRPTWNGTPDYLYPYEKHESE